MAKPCGCVVCFVLLAAMPLPAEAPGLSEMYALIRAEETNNSKIMWIIHEIADVYGPRLTGTTNLKAADDWAVKTMTSWGLGRGRSSRRVPRRRCPVGKTWSSWRKPFRRSTGN